MAPIAELPPGIPLTAHSTATSEVPLTLAVNPVVFPSRTVADPGATLTVTLGGGGGGGTLVPPPLAHAAAHTAHPRTNVRTLPLPRFRIVRCSEHAGSPRNLFPIWNRSVSLRHSAHASPLANSFSSPRRTVDTTSDMHNHGRNASCRRAATRKELFFGDGLYLSVCVSRDSQRAARLRSGE